MANVLGVSQTTVVRGLRSIGKVPKLGRWVPHALMQRDMDRRCEVGLSLLTFKRHHHWLIEIITGDEKWILYSNSHSRAQWVDKDADAKTSPNPIHTRKR